MISRSLHPLQAYVFPSLLVRTLVAGVALGAIGLAGVGCDKNSTASPDNPKDVVKAIDESEKGRQPDSAKTEAKTEANNEAAPVSTEPIPGVDVSKLGEEKKARFYRLVDRDLQSPCGKAHSLRKSLTEDQSCKRAPFAARAVVQLLDDEATNDDVTDWYAKRYLETKKHDFTLEGVPHIGPADAPVQLVEFYDYGCPSCKEFKPLLEQVAEGFPSQLAVFYKQFPLPAHPDSKPAAQAALAAWKMGKFTEMHDVLFAQSHRHKVSDLKAHAKSLGLAAGDFDKLYASMLERVEADISEGDAAGVNGTPTLFLNGVTYPGPFHPRYLRMAIEEEIAVNR